MAYEIYASTSPSLATAPSLEETPVLASVGKSYSIKVPVGPGVTLHIDEQGQGYEIYSTIGPITTQKQYIGRDGGCATFGTADVLGSHVQIQGCLKLNPVRFEGKVEACAFKHCKSHAFSLPLS